MEQLNTKYFLNNEFKLFIVVFDDLQGLRESSDSGSIEFFI